MIVSFQEPLDSSQTYSLSFGEGIVDNNENNPLYGLSYSFSTGSTIDSMMLSGTVVDAMSLFPIGNATVALYLQAKDSTVMTTRPDAIARSDKWGYFTVKNLKPQPYHIFAYTDGNTNNRYDQGGEMIAFCDTTVTPVKVMKKDSPELKYYDPKDDNSVWFGKMKELCDELGYASDMKAYKKNPEAFKGNVADVSMVIRVALTSKSMTPDLHEIMAILGVERIKERFSKLK